MKFISVNRKYIYFLLFSSTIHNLFNNLNCLSTHLTAIGEKFNDTIPPHPYRKKETTYDIIQKTGETYLADKACSAQC